MPAALGLLFALAALPLAALELELQPGDIEPEVQIKDRANRRVEEYRVNGQLYMIKIQPSVGAPYYLVDDTGTGDFEYRRSTGGREFKVPQWTLFSW